MPGAVRRGLPGLYAEGQALFVRSTQRRVPLIYAACVAKQAVRSVKWRQKGGGAMDQVKIGRFIAEQRKARQLTQRQLAGELDISDKTISKWETGVSHS